MRRLLTRALSALALVVLLSAPALAIDVTVAGVSYSGYNYGGPTATIRFYASDTFTASTGEIVVAGQIGSTTAFSRAITCTVASTTLTCPSVTLPSTTDSPDLPTATWTAVLFDSKGTKRDFVPVSDFKLPHTLGASTTWRDVRLYNAAPPRAPAPGFPTFDYLNTILQGYAQDSNTFITQTPSADLPGEQALSALATGLLYNTTGTGVLSSVANGAESKVLTVVSGVPAWANNGNTVHWLDARDYGVLCDGSADDDDEIQAAHTAALASGKGVALPAGICMVDALTWDARVPLKGVRFDQFTSGLPAGTGTLLRSRSAAVTVTMTNPSGTVPYASGKIEDLTFDGANLGTTGLQMTGIQRFKIERVNFIRYTLQGVSLLGSLMGEFESCHFNSNARGVFASSASLSGIGTMVANLISWKNCFFQVNTAWAADLNNGAWWKFDNCDFELNGTGGVTNSGAIKVTTPTPNSEGISLIVNGGWFEQNRGFALIRLGAPAVQYGRAIIRDVISVAGSELHGVYVESGGSGLQYQLVHVDNSSMRGSATSDLTVSGANAALRVTNTVFDTKSIASGAGFSTAGAVDTGGNSGGDQVSSIFQERTELAGTRNAIQSLPSGGGLDFHFSKGCYHNGSGFVTSNPALPCWNFNMQTTADVFNIRRAAAGASPSFTDLFTLSNAGRGTFAGAVKIADEGARPTCNSTTRGTFWLDEGGAGVADTVAVCAKDAADAYGWRTIY